MNLTPGTRVFHIKKGWAGTVVSMNKPNWREREGVLVEWDSAYISAAVPVLISNLCPIPGAPNAFATQVPVDTYNGPRFALAHPGEEPAMDAPVLIQNKRTNEWTCDAWQGRLPWEKYLAKMSEDHLIYVMPMF